MGNNVLDITGQKFGRLSAVKYLGNRNWLFSCDCGNEKIINGYAVRSGQTKSCGCYISEKTTERSTKHKMSRSRLYRIYAYMKYSVEEALFKKKGANRSSNVIAENITTGEKLEFESQKELAECIGSTVSNVNKCVKGKLKQTCGYKIYYNK